MDILLIIFILSIISAFFLAWTIGANDVANAMGTSVGSKAITIKQAIIIAAIFEFAGAILVGSSVTKTVGEGIIDLSLFKDKYILLLLGMLAALLATSLWVFIATTFELPVSTSHSIVGAVVGFGVVSLGVSTIKWATISQIALSWIVSPLMGGFIAYYLFVLIKKIIFDTKHPVKSFKKICPYLIFTTVFIITLSVLYKGLENLHLNLNIFQAILWSSLISALFSVGSIPFINRIQEVTVEKDNKYGTKELKMEFTKVETVFNYLQLLTACSVAFAHGANDVANAIGPLSIIISVWQNKSVVISSYQVPLWVLLLGGSGIVLGLATYGYKVIATIGTKITELTPSRGFAAQFAASATVLFASKLGLPISTTHTIVGAVIGVGFARGLNGINIKVVWNILSSWVITLPFTAILSILIYKIGESILKLFNFI